MISLRKTEAFVPFISYLKNFCRPLLEMKYICMRARQLGLSILHCIPDLRK